MLMAFVHNKSIIIIIIIIISIIIIIISIIIIIIIIIISGRGYFSCRLDYMYKLCEGQWGNEGLVTCILITFWRKFNVLLKQNFFYQIIGHIILLIVKHSKWLIFLQK